MKYRTYKCKQLRVYRLVDSMEQLWLTIMFKKKPNTFSIVYRFPGVQLESCLSELRDVVEANNLEIDHIVLVGNINFLHS